MPVSEVVEVMMGFVDEYPEVGRTGTAPPALLVDVVLLVEEALDNGRHSVVPQMRSVGQHPPPREAGQAW